MAKSSTKKKSKTTPLVNMDHYILEVHLQPLSLPKKQKITRTISVPSNTTFSQLHIAIFEAFQWDDYHSYHFTIHDCETWTKKNERKSKDDNALLKIKKTSKTTVGEILGDEKYEDKVLEYVWDGWSHIIKVKKVEEVGSGRMELVKASKWIVPAEFAPFPIYEFRDEEKEKVEGKLREIVCGVEEEVSGDEKDLGEEDESEDEDEENGISGSGEEDDVTEALEGQGSNLVSDSVEKEVGSQVLKNTLIGGNKRRLESSPVQEAPLKKKSRSS